MNISRPLRVFGLSICPFLYFSGVGKAQTTVRVPTAKSSAQPVAKTPTAPTAFELLVVRYLNDIQAVAQQKRNLLIEQRQNDLQEMEKVSTRVATNETQILSDLRAQAASRPNRKLLFYAESPERILLLPSSPAAARIARALYSDGLIGSTPLYAMFNQAEALVPEWVSLFMMLQSKHIDGSNEWDTGAKLLFKANAGREKYQNRIIEMAKNGDAEALKLLLFQTSKETGEQISIVSAGNLKLIREIANRPLSSSIEFYAAKLVCAKYAILLRDYDLPLKVCTEILALKFVSQDTSKIDIEKDMPIFDAKRRSLDLLFYEVKNEEALKIVYDRSRIVGIESKKYESVLPRGLADLTSQKWVSYSAHPAARLEIDFAQSLIFSIQGFSK